MSDMGTFDDTQAKMEDEPGHGDRPEPPCCSESDNLVVIAFNVNVHHVEP